MKGERATGSQWASVFVARECVKSPLCISWTVTRRGIITRSDAAGIPVGLRGESWRRVFRCSFTGKISVITRLPNTRGILYTAFSKPPWCGKLFLICTSRKEPPLTWHWQAKLIFSEVTTKVSARRHIARSRDCLATLWLRKNHPSGNFRVDRFTALPTATTRVRLPSLNISRWNLHLRRMWGHFCRALLTIGQSFSGENIFTFH